VAPVMEISGLEDEYRLAAGMPMLLYLKRPAPELEPRLAAMIDGIYLKERADEEKGQ
jgi:hypothetical protein